MRIFLIGGGTGGHITPLLAVARELKALRPDAELVGICEKDAKFVGLYKQEPAIDRVFQVWAGKYRRYSGLKWHEKMFDLKTLFLNTRDAWRTLVGYVEARRLLKSLQPDILLIKGGFIAVPLGKAAARLGIPYLTHDSDSMPGLANRLISGSAIMHATGMPAEMYRYPKEKTVYTGIPLDAKFKKVTPSLRATYRETLGLGGCEHVLTIVGGSLGAGQLNLDTLSIAPELCKRFPGLGIVHIAGKPFEEQTRAQYAASLPPDDAKRVVVRGFADDVDVCQGAADVVITRAGATQTAELALQALPIVVVPGKLAGGHQDKNAVFLSERAAAVKVAFGDASGLLDAVTMLLENPSKRMELSENLHALAKPQAAQELAELVLNLAAKQGR